MRKLILILMLTMLATPAGASDLAAGRKLLARYGWTCQSSTVEMSLSLSQSLAGNPESHYQSASQAIGLDLRGAAGQEVTLIRYSLSQRSQESNSALYAHVAFHKGHIIGAWLSTDAPIAPGIASLDDSDFGHDF